VLQITNSVLVGYEERRDELRLAASDIGEDRKQEFDAVSTFTTNTDDFEGSAEEMRH